MSTLKFLEFEAKSFAGISEDRAAVILFDHEDAEGNIVRFSGDQGVGKTSLMNAVKAILGGEMPSNAINGDDKKVSGRIAFKTSKGQTVNVAMTKSNFTVKITDEDGMTTHVSNPKTWLRELIGPLGVSPMVLKEKDGKAQVKFVRDMAKLSLDMKVLEGEIAERFDTDFKKRTSIGREVKKYAAQLKDSPFFSYDKEHDVFVPTSFYDETIKKHEAGAGDAEKINAEFQAANEDNNKLAQYKDRAFQLKESLVVKENEKADLLARIERLKQEVIGKDSEIEDIQGRIEKGAELMAELSDAPDKFRTSQQALFSLNQFNEQKKAADDHAWKARQYSVETESYEKQSALLEEWAQKKREFVKAITPDIEGVEVRVKRDLDLELEEDIFRQNTPEATEDQVAEYILNLKSDNVDGLFYNNRSVDQLCESELWDLCLKMWQLMGVNVVFIENVNSLGTDAVDQINRFAEKGKVFVSEMERSQKEIRISFHNAIQ